MAGGNASRTGATAIAAVAAALTLSFPSIAAAGQCSPSKRVDHRNAECLDASWKNRGTFKASTLRVRNRCAAYGTVVAKVDLVAARDLTLRLDGPRAIRGRAWRRIRSISCCSDMGICNRSDVVTDEGCLARFKRVSPAAPRCRNPTASAAISGENYSCIVTAQCRNSFSHLFRYIPSTITVPFAALGDVHNCGGVLQRWPCGEDPPDTATVSVRDADAVEAPGAVLYFRVFLSRTLPGPVRIDYATRGFSARSGSDFRRTSGTLTFAAGETAKTISVPVLDDSHDEKPETMTLTLSNPRPSSRVRLKRETAYGTIWNTDPMPRAWIGRFGRTVADQVLDAVDARMRTKPAPGVEARLAGQRIGSGPPFGAGPDREAASAQVPAPQMRPGGRDAPDDADAAHRSFGSRPGSPWHRKATSERDLLPGSSLSLTAETGGTGFVSVWGRGAATRFSGRQPGSARSGDDLAVDGEVASGLLGADLTWGPGSGSGSGSWTAGLVVSHSLGDGDYRSAGRGTVSATLTGMWPWMRHALSERLSLWGVAGYGEGSLSLEPGNADGTRAGDIRTGLDLMMAAVGLRGVAVDGGRDGLTLAVKADAMVLRTRSAAVRGGSGNLAAATADVTRLRFGLQGSRPFRLAERSVLTPSAEIGMRRDGGDAETGFGMEIGAGLLWTDPQRGLSAELRGRGLLTHESKGFRERGLSGAVFWNPGAGDRGPRLSVTQTLGAAGQGGADTLYGRATLGGLAVRDDLRSGYAGRYGPGAGAGGGLRNRRLEARFGYGFAAFGDRFTATPEIAVGLSDTGRDYSLSWRLVRGGRAPDGSVLELAVEAGRRETDDDRNIPQEHTVGFRVTSRF